MLRCLFYLSVLCWYCLFCLQISNKNNLKKTLTKTPKVYTLGKIYLNHSFSHSIFTVLSLPVSGSAIKADEENKRIVLKVFKTQKSFEV